MSEEVVVAAFGRPDSVEEADGATGRSRVWTRRRDGIDHRYKHTYESVHFADGVVTSWAR